MGPLFSQSWERTLPGRGEEGCIFCVYSGYESDEHGAFDVTAGWDRAATSLPRCLGPCRSRCRRDDYLVFHGHGTMPQMVIDAWGEVWRYFAAHPQLPRRLAPISSCMKARTAWPSISASRSRCAARMTSLNQELHP